MHKDSAGQLGFQFKEGKITAIAVNSSSARNGLLIEHNLLEVNQGFLFRHTIHLCPILVGNSLKKNLSFSPKATWGLQIKINLNFSTTNLLFIFSATGFKETTKIDSTPITLKFYNCFLLIVVANFLIS